MREDGKYRVLVVDDEASVLLTYRLILEQQGYDVVACGTAREAITAIDEQQSFDVVLCDYSLEEQHTGFEVISAARKRSPEMPAALLTGYATKDTADEASSHGIGIMFKPIEIDEFLATTSSMVRRKNESNQKGGEKGNPAPQTGNQG
ncbi:MAG TPA: response regulator [Candidatus Angelobacter sp.]|nr:response regulator [Candidatus Angelobacter sp.]